MDITVEHRCDKAVARLNAAISGYRDAIFKAREAIKEETDPYTVYELRKGVAECYKHIRICRKNRATWDDTVNMDLSEYES